MKKTLQLIVQTRRFEAVLLFGLFMIVSLGMDYAIDGFYSLWSIMADTIMSLVVAGIFYADTDIQKLHPKTIKRRSDHFTLAGMLGIAYLLIVVFIISYMIG
jgi:hypothetical protein